MRVPHFEDLCLAGLEGPGHRHFAAGRVEELYSPRPVFRELHQPVSGLEVRRRPRGGKQVTMPHKQIPQDLLARDRPAEACRSRRPKRTTTGDGRGTQRLHGANTERPCLAQQARNTDYGVLILTHCVPTGCRGPGEPWPPPGLLAKLCNASVDSAAGHVGTRLAVGESSTG
jgi:hypothetical protein